METVYDKLDKGRYEVKLVVGDTESEGASLEARLGVLAKGTIETPIGSVACWEFHPANGEPVIQAKTMAEVRFTLEQQLFEKATADHLTPMRLRPAAQPAAQEQLAPADDAA